MAEHRYLAGNALVCGDNYAALRELPDECIDLVYLDPPLPVEAKARKSA